MYFYLYQMYEAEWWKFQFNLIAYTTHRYCWRTVMYKLLTRIRIVCENNFTEDQICVIIFHRYWIHVYFCSSIAAICSDSFFRVNRNLRTDRGTYIEGIKWSSGDKDTMHERYSVVEWQCDKAVDSESVPCSQSLGDPPIPCLIVSATWVPAGR